MLGGQPYRRAVTGIALGKARVLDQPTGGQLHPFRRRVVGYGRVRGPLEPVQLRGCDDRVGEERADAPGVVVGLVEDHALAPAQHQYGVTHQGRVGAGARLGAQFRGQLAVAQRRAAAVGIESELDLQHDCGIGVLENACAVTESEFIAADPAVLAGGTVQQSNPPDRVGDLGAVRADVLHRCRACRAGYPRQTFQAAEAVVQRGDDDVVPHGTRLRAQDIAVDADARIGQPNHRQVGHVVGQHDIRPAGQHQHPLIGFGVTPVQGAHHVEDLFGALAGDQAACDRADTQRGQRSDRHLLGDRRTP